MKKIGNIAILLGILLLLLIFTKPLILEINYQIKNFSGVSYLVSDPNMDTEQTNNDRLFFNEKAKYIEPVDLNFGIVIPKIKANAKIFAEVSPFDSKGYLPVLKEGVAHAKGTGFPGGGRNIYLFAHSTDSFLNFRQYNAVFYLLGKLENGDEIDIFYKNSLFRYEVIEKKVVFPEAIHYLDSDEEEILTLQTCYPPGTTLKRLIVRAKKKEINN